MCRRSVSALLFVLAVMGQICTAGLVAHWDLEEGSGTTTTAAVGSPQADGTLVGATWITAELPPLLGTSAALFFRSASADRVETTHPGVLGQGARSVTAWIRAEPVQANNAVVIGWGTNVNDQRYSFRLNKSAADGIAYAIRLEIQGSRVVATTPVNDGQWHHIAVSHGDGARIGEVSFYVDSNPDAISGTSGGGLINTASTSVVLGTSGHAPTTYGFDGALDDVRIYDHILTQAQIQQIMEGVRPGQATEPSPADGATDVPRDVTLRWAPGETAGTRDVYLGSAFADVNDAGRTNPMGVLISQGRTNPEFDPADLTYGQTYYWRIDEINATPDNTVFKGNTWSFTVEPYGYPIAAVTATASSAQPNMGPENTINGSGLNADDEHSTELTEMWMSSGTLPNWIQYEFDRVYKLHELWVWNSNQMIEPLIGFGARDVKIGCSVDGATWTTLEEVPEFARATGSPTYQANTLVPFDGVWARYVKLTIDRNWGVAPQTGLSEVRFFYVPVQAFGPEPADGATGVAIDTDLNWRPGREAVSHEVYFGADENALTLVATPTEHHYTPASLNFGATYFWQVNEIGGSGPYEGTVWSFTTQDFASIDDFEAYNDDDNRIFDTWIDGWVNNTGSQVGYEVSPFAERLIVHGGWQSMPFIYDNESSPFYSEAEREFATAQDWTVRGADTLSLWVQDAPADLYVVVQDSAGKSARATQPPAAMAGQWTRWTIPFSDLAGVNMSRVKKMVIGVGNKAAPVAGSAGTFYIDDIGFGHPLP